MPAFPEETAIDAETGPAPIDAARRRDCEVARLGSAIEIVIETFVDFEVPLAGSAATGVAAAATGGFDGTAVGTFVATIAGTATPATLGIAPPPPPPPPPPLQAGSTAATASAAIVRIRKKRVSEA